MFYDPEKIEKQVSAVKEARANIDAEYGLTRARQASADAELQLKHIQNTRNDCLASISNPTTTVFLKLARKKELTQLEQYLKGYNEQFEDAQVRIVKITTNPDYIRKIEDWEKSIEQFPFVKIRFEIEKAEADFRQVDAEYGLTRARQASANAELQLKHIQNTRNDCLASISNPTTPVFLKLARQKELTQLEQDLKGYNEQFEDAQVRIVEISTNPRYIQAKRDAEMLLICKEGELAQMIEDSRRMPTQGRSGDTTTTQQTQPNIACFAPLSEEADEKFDRDVAAITKLSDEDQLNSAERTTYELYLCPLSLEIIKYPVVASDGRTYEETALRRLFSSPNEVHSPMDPSIILNPSIVIPNHQMRSSILEWMNSTIRTHSQSQKATATDGNVPTITTASLVGAIWDKRVDSDQTLPQDVSLDATNTTTFTSGHQ